MTSRQTLYVASGNAGKLRDFAAAAEACALADVAGWEILPVPGLASIPAPEEDADTFEGNARAKAVYYSLHAPGEIVVADDSGLEVDALGGAPGVYSARYAARASAPGFAGGGTLDERNNQHLLKELAHVLAENLLANLDHRTARYRCVLAAARDGVCSCTGEGSVEGAILLSPRGKGGFGYDPLFYLPTLGQTMAEIDAVTRLTLSHRGKALRALLPRLASLLPS